MWHIKTPRVVKCVTRVVIHTWCVETTGHCVWVRGVEQVGYGQRQPWGMALCTGHRSALQVPCLPPGWPPSPGWLVWYTTWNGGQSPGLVREDATWGVTRPPVSPRWGIRRGSVQPWGFPVGWRWKGRTGHTHPWYTPAGLVYKPPLPSQFTHTSEINSDPIQKPPEIHSYNISPMNSLNIAVKRETKPSFISVRLLIISLLRFSPGVRDGYLLPLRRTMLTLSGKS